MIIKPFKSAIPRFTRLFSTDLFFDSVKENFPRYYLGDFYENIGEEALYIYQYESVDRSYTGLVTCTDTADYESGAIVKHEDTLVAKEQKQRKLAQERQAMIKPILLTYPKSEHIDGLLHDYVQTHKALFSVEFKEARHTYWKITEKDSIEQITTAFQDRVPRAYIADGHHRAATMMHIHQETQNPFFSKIFSVYLSFEEVEISNWNRVIFGLNGLSPLEVMAELSRFFHIKRIAAPYQTTVCGVLVMTLDQQWFELRWRDEVLEQYKGLPLEQQFDISIFNKEIAQGVLGIGNIRNDERIENIESRKGFEGLQRLIDRAEVPSIGFIFSPIDLEDMIKVTNAGRIMPPKSTYMLPRIINGMLVYPLHDKPHC